MRKISRQKDAAWALEVMDKAPYITVSMTRPDGTPYGLPLNIARKDERVFYFHCADEGEKIDCLRYNPVVSLSAGLRLSATTGRRLRLNDAIFVCRPDDNWMPGGVVLNVWRVCDPER